MPALRPARVVTVLPQSPALQGWNFRTSLSLFCLTFAAMFGQLDRVLFGYVMPQIKEEMLVSDTVLGLLAGAAFTVMYLLLAIPMAWLADRTNRRWVIGLGLAFWSLMTTLSGFASNIIQLAALRALVGAGESTNLGPSKSIVADLFPRANRPIGLSIISAAPTLSGILLVPIAGWIASGWGWRQAFIWAGIGGLVIAALFLFLVREPKIGASEDKPIRADVIPLQTSIRILLQSRTYVLLALASSFMAGFTYTTSSWETSFLVRVHGFDIAEAAHLLGPIRGIMGLLGLGIGIYLARRLGSRESRRLLVAPVAAFGLAITEAIFLLTDSITVVYVSAFVAGVFYTIHVGIVYNVLTSIVLPRCRGVGVALFVVFGVIWGQSLGPFLVGGISDLLQPAFGDLSIRYGLLVSVAFATGGGIFFLLARRTVDAELARIEALIATD